MSKGSWRSVRTRVRLAGEPEPGTSLYKVLYPGGRGKDKRAEEKPDVSEKQIKVIQSPPRIHIPGGP